MSIKKKLATAFATAGLLAGLFGSAFVTPASALSFASINWKDDSSEGQYYEIYSGYLGDTTGEYVYCDSNLKDDDYMPGTDAGFDDGDRGLIGDGVVVPTGLSEAQACPAHSPSLVDEDGETVNDYLYFDTDFGYEGGLVTTRNGLVDTEDVTEWIIEGDDVLVIYNYDSDVDDWDNTLYLDGDINNDGNCDAGEEVCDDNDVEFYIIPESGDQSGIASFTVTAVHNGVETEIGTWYIQFYGPVTDISVATPNFTHLAALSSEAVMTEVTFEDESGNDLLAAGLPTEDVIECTPEDFTPDDSCDGDDGVAELLFEVGGELDEADLVMFDKSGDDEDGPVVTLAEDFCGEAGIAAGKSTTIEGWIDQDADGVMDSKEPSTGEWNVKCTGSKSGASISSITLAASTSAPSSSGTARKIALDISVVDSTGGPLGYLGDGVQLAFATDTYGEAYPETANYAPIDPYTNLDLSSMYVIDGKAFDTNAVVDVPFYLFVGSREYVGKQTFVITVDKNLVKGGATAAEKAFTLSYEVTGQAGSVPFGEATITKVNKTTAKISIPLAAGRLVTITLEKASTGVVRNAYRKADAAGNVTFKLLRPGKWVVFAAYGNAVTDAIRLKK